MPTGYCTVEDVRRVLQETDAEFDSGASGEDDNQVVVDAIVSQYEWIRDSLDRHFYEADGIDEDEQELVPTEADDRDREEHDIPSTPHPQHSQLFVHRRRRYPRRMNGPYTRIRLDKHYAEEITALEVRNSAGRYEDWVDADSKEEGDDYALYVDPGANSSPSYVDIRTSSIPALQHYDHAVRVSYTFGLNRLPSTLRRGVAMRAAAQLLAADDDAALGIPDSGNLVAQESKVRALERQANELLEAYL